ncbi:MAG: PHB depolymerase family esterase [Hydrogenophaga sp.]|jgi:poly(hydroxyalkanoate) depolymerase family esterase|nr:PHB depolymerase family esterase [Hydrogenophaga sp.]
MNIQETIDRALKSAGLNTQSGPLRGVTDTIRNALASAGLVVGAAATPAQAAAPGDDTIDVVAREVPTPGSDTADAAPAGGQFVLRSFTAPAGTRAYKLYVPAQATGAQMPKTAKTATAGALPLVVMLHGCTQSADDFAAGTQMNRLADEHGFLVVYPEQASGANASRCWNWFRAEDQQRGAGEPALLAALVQSVVAEHPVDPGRVYVAGLSAGAAMAVILGETYPELFAAVGAHSGLPYAAAHDIPSAMAAMKGRGVMGMGHLPGTPDDPRRPARQAVPVIVFHGDRDHTVQHSNGEHIVQQAASAHAARPAGLRASTEQGQTPSGRSYTRTRHTNAQGRCLVELWTLHGAGHAWSGGDARGSFTDGNGPDASAEMLRFFLAQPKNN